MAQVNKAEKALNGILEDVWRSSIPGEFKSDFRVSSLPFCGLHDFFSHLVAVDKGKNGSGGKVQGTHRKRLTDEPFSQRFYTNIGTAVHDTAQAWLFARRDELGIDIFSQFSCSRCGRKTEVGFYSEVCGAADKEASQCCMSSRGEGCDWQFEEIEYEIRGDEIPGLRSGKRAARFRKLKLSGHSDFVFRVVATGVVYLLDFKTTSNYLFSAAAAIVNKKIRDGEYPRAVYWRQIEAYAWLLWKKYRLKVDHYALIYVNRSSVEVGRKPQFRVFSREWTKKRFLATGEKLADDFRQYKLRVDVGEEYKKGKKVARLIENRPCHSLAEYKDRMGMKFTYESCPLVHLCSRGMDAKIERRLAHPLE